MPIVKVNGSEIFYDMQGTGEPFLLIAGFACDHTAWSVVTPLLAAHYRVIAFDNRGVGQSSRPKAAAGIREMAADVAGLLDALGLGPVHVAGHSMGGMVAQELALSRPELVRSLILLSSCARLDERGKAIIEAWGDLPSQGDTATATRLILPWMYTSAFYAQAGAVERLIELILANPFPSSVQEIYRQSRAISAFDALHRLGEINCPTLVAVGSEDILLPVACTEELARSIRGAELVVLARTGHGLLLESPDAVAKTMLKFLEHRQP